jgi:acid phosphatase family membrane protein YuiD
MIYVLAPFVAWFMSGCLKFFINYLRFGKEAKNRIGNGGFPSTHTTIITTSTILIGWADGFTSPLFGLGIAVSYIIIIDALGLRRAVGIQASHINKNFGLNLRESMGHNLIEVLGGIILGSVISTLLHFVF